MLLRCAIESKGSCVGRPVSPRSHHSRPNGLERSDQNPEKVAEKAEGRFPDGPNEPLSFPDGSNETLSFPDGSNGRRTTQARAAQKREGASPCYHQRRYS